MLKDSTYARDIIATMERETKSRAARRRMAEIAAGPLGQYTEEAKALWREYLQSLT